MPKRMCGFSLIELMLVVTIICILSALALPAYHHYAKRARFIEIITTTEPYKLAVAIALQTGVELSELSHGMHGIPAPPKSTKHLASLLVEEGVITATATSLIDNATFVLKPNHDGNHWSISGTCLKSGLCAN